MKLLRRLFLVKLFLISLLLPYACTEKIEPEFCMLYIKDTFFVGIDAEIVRPINLNAVGAVKYSSFPYGLLVAEKTGELNINTSQGGIYRVSADYEAPNASGRVVKRVCNMMLRVNNIYYGGEYCVAYDLDAEMLPFYNGEPIDQIPLPPRAEFDTPPGNEISATSQGLVINTKTGAIDLLQTMMNVQLSGTNEKTFTLYYRIGDNANVQKINIIFTVLGIVCDTKSGGRIERPGFRVRVASL